MASRERPLSPFLIYRFDYTMVLSFAHRGTGILLSVGALAVVAWLLALACGRDAYTHAVSLLDSWGGRLLLLGWLFSFFYHLANGIRHLAWDLGYGFGKPRARLTGWIVVIAAVAMTAAYVWMALGFDGSVP
jgi:succinate dehydrogenase / fumarate reductase cytochrome b subunit